MTARPVVQYTIRVDLTDPTAIVPDSDVFEDYTDFVAEAVERALTDARIRLATSLGKQASVVVLAHDVNDPDVTPTEV